MLAEIYIIQSKIKVYVVIKTSAGAQHGLWHMHTVVFVKIGYKRAEESRGEQKNGPSDL